MTQPLGKCLAHEAAPGLFALFGDPCSQFLEVWWELPAMHRAQQQSKGKWGLLQLTFGAMGHED